MEYAGYVSPDSFVDYEALSGKLAEKIYGIGTKRAAEKEALDKAMRDSEALINDPSALGQNQTMNTLVLDGADRAKTNIYNWNKQLKNGQISPKDYKERINTLNEYWSILANSAKTFDQRYQEVMKRQQPDENGIIQASAYELELANRFGQMADLNNSRLQFGDNGRVYMSKVDPKTGEIVSELTDVRTINSPENIVANRIVVPTAVENLTSSWDPWTTFKDLGRGGELNIEDVRQNPQFEMMKAKVAESVASDNNPRAQVSVLVDNGVINADYYMNDAEYEQKKQEAIDQLKKTKETAGLKTDVSSDELKEIELSLVKLEKDPSGIINPVLSDEQKKLAKERVKQEVEIQMEKKITGSPKQQWSSGGGGGGGGSTSKEDEMMRGYVSAAKAFGIDPFKTKETGSVVYSGGSDFGGLSKSYQYRKTAQGVEVYRSGDLDPVSNVPIKDEKTGDRKPIRIAKQPSELAQYVFNGEAAAAGADFDKARIMFYEGSTPQKSSNITQSEFNSKWAKLKSGQSLVGPDGKTYTKK